jgi:hypothetical protein
MPLAKVFGPVAGFTIFLLQRRQRYSNHPSGNLDAEETDVSAVTTLVGLPMEFAGGGI